MYPFDQELRREYIDNAPTRTPPTAHAATIAFARGSPRRRCGVARRRRSSATSARSDVCRLSPQGIASAVVSPVSKHRRDPHLPPVAGKIRETPWSRRENSAKVRKRAARRGRRHELAATAHHKTPTGQRLPRPRSTATHVVRLDPKSQTFASAARTTAPNCEHGICGVAAARHERPRTSG